MREMEFSALAARVNFFHFSEEASRFFFFHVKAKEELRQFFNS